MPVINKKSAKNITKVVVNPTKEDIELWKKLLEEMSKDPLYSVIIDIKIKVV